MGDPRCAHKCKYQTKSSFSFSFFTRSESCFADKRNERARRRQAKEKTRRMRMHGTIDTRNDCQQTTKKRDGTVPSTQLPTSKTTKRMYSRTHRHKPVLKEKGDKHKRKRKRKNTQVGHPLTLIYPIPRGFSRSFYLHRYASFQTNTKQRN